MLKRLNILTRLQLSNKFRKSNVNWKSRTSFILTRLLVFLIAIAVIFGLLYVVQEFVKITITMEVVTSLVLITQVISILATTNGLMKDLYESGDNPILFSLPVKNNEVFLSKLTVFYILEFIKNLYFIIPLLLGAGILLKMGVGYYVTVVFLTLLLPLISVLISSIVSIPITYLKNFMKGKTIANLIISVLMIVLLLILVYLIATKIPNPLYVLSQINHLTTVIQEFMVSVSSYGVIYLSMGNLLFASSVSAVFIQLGIIIGGAILLLGINYLIAIPVYFNLVSSSKEHTTKTSKKEKNKQESSLFKTFMLKEFRISMRNINQVLTDYMLLILMPFVMYLLNDVFLSVNSNELGQKIGMVFNILIILMFVLASNTASATAITKEGYEFVLLKTAPSETKTIAWAKIIFNVIFSNGLILITFIIFQIAFPNPGVNFGYLWHLFIVVVLVNCGHILWSFQIDITNPSLSEYAQTGSLEGNKNAKQSVTIGLVISIIATLIFLFFIFLYPALTWYGMIIVAVIFLLARLHLFNQYLNAYFTEIEY